MPDIDLPEGNLHDGDVGSNICPTFMAAVDVMVSSEVRQQELRTDAWLSGTVHAEWQWCRHFIGDLRAPAVADPRTGVPLFAPSTISFPPAKGDETSFLGEWVMDFSTNVSRETPGPEDGKAEIHEVWMYVTRSPDSSPPVGSLASNIALGGVDFRVSAEFPNERIPNLQVTATMPERSPAEASGAFNNIECIEIVTGCKQPRVKATATANNSDRTIVFKVTPSPDSDEANLAVSTYSCDKSICDGRTTPAGVLQSIATTQGGACNIPGGKPAYSGVFRCYWKDPLDLWSCGNCGCADLAASPAKFAAPVTGCAALNLDPNNAADRKKACAQVCGGLTCGIAPACKLGSCNTAPTAPDDDATLLARNACVPPQPMTRVAPMGDFRIDFGGPSTLRFGTLGPDSSIASFTEIGRTAVTGNLFLNLGADAFANFAQLSFMRLNAANFSYGMAPALHSVQNPNATLLTRGRAKRVAPNEYDFLAGQLLLAVRAKIDADNIESEIISQSDVHMHFNPLDGTFTLNGSGGDENGIAVIINLVGTVSNYPPVANAGPDRTIECSSPTNSPLLLDGRASVDSDTGDSISHYQWFEIEEEVAVGVESDGPKPLGVGATLTLNEPIGEHEYRLHVYDNKRGSHSDEVKYTVVDTTPPQLIFTQTPTCLWPPNHTFARFTLGNELKFTTNDTCDSNVKTRIVDVKSNEPMNATGDGNTAVDVAFGPTTACVRSERAGNGIGRSYTITVEAKDASGNTSLHSVQVVVPHDKSGHPNCTRAEGIEAIDDMCRK
jgi:hypothetical protein